VVIDDVPVMPLNLNHMSNTPLPKHYPSQRPEPPSGLGLNTKDPPALPHYHKACLIKVLGVFVCNTVLLLCVGNQLKPGRYDAWIFVEGSLKIV
jgi:hypothetical protein